MFKNENEENIFRVTSTFNPKFEIEFLHEDYSINSGKRNMTETGYMVVFELDSRSTSPRFIGRWDQNEELLDVDILGVDKKAVSDFRAGKNGYYGHHPLRISESPRLFQIEINIPERKY